jgi:RNA polymerase sigma factor (sigma-70 family)
MEGVPFSGESTRKTLSSTAEGTGSRLAGKASLKFRRRVLDWGHRKSLMDDLEFVRKCIKDDPNAWNEFIEKYSRLIYNYIYQVLKAKSVHQTNEQHVDDIFQEIFLLLTQNNFRKLSTFKAKNNCRLASWLRQVVVNYTIDYLRKVKPVISLDEESDSEFSLKNTLSDHSPAPSESLESKEKVSGLKDCIRKLDTDDKFFMELHLNQGITLEELKMIFKVSRGAVDMRKSRIIERLKACFKSKGFALDL